jgi:hypothetical protein
LQIIDSKQNDTPNPNNPSIEPIPRGKNELKTSTPLRLTEEENKQNLCIM